jgi:hypothetical protein
MRLAEGDVVDAELGEGVAGFEAKIALDKIAFGALRRGGGGDQQREGEEDAMSVHGANVSGNGLWGQSRLKINRV